MELSKERMPHFDERIYKCYILFHEAMDFVTKCEDITFNKAGLPYQQCIILVAMLYLKSNFSLNALAKKIHREPNTISAIINRMVSDGLIRRVRDRKDRRSIRLTITDKGMEKLKKTFGKGWTLINRLFSCFTNEELTTFSILLNRLGDRAFNEFAPGETREIISTDTFERLSESLS